MKSIYAGGLLSVLNVSKIFKKINLAKLFLAIRVPVALILLAVLAIWIITIIFFQPSVQMSPKTDLDPVATEALRPTALDKVMKLFAPWESPEVNSSGEAISDPRALAMLHEDGGLRVSPWGIQLLDERWSISKPPEISRMSAENGKVTLVTNKGRMFTVALGQPFILEQMPQRVYVVTADRKILSIPTDIAGTLRYLIKYVVAAE